MKKNKTKLFINNKELEIDDSCYEFLRLFSEWGFFREICNFNFLSQNEKRHNPLISMFDSSSEQSGGLAAGIETSRVVTEFMLWLESFSGLGEKEFFVSSLLANQIHLLSNFFKINIPERAEAACPPKRTVEGAAGSSEGGLPAGADDQSGRQKTNQPERSKRRKLTAGSKNQNRNDLPPDEKPVKHKMKTSKISMKNLLEKEEEVTKEELALAIPKPGMADEIDMELMGIAEAWMQHAQSIASWREYNLDKFYGALILIKNRLNLNNTGLLEILNFCKADHFWRDKIVSPIQLLKKSKNELRKIDNILISMKKRISVTSAEVNEREWQYLETF